MIDSAIYAAGVVLPGPSSLPASTQVPSWTSAGAFAGWVTGVSAHSALTGLTTGDDHTQHALLAGRATPQTFAFGTASGATAGYFTSTAHATKGSYSLNSAGTIVVDEANVSLLIGGISAISGLQLVVDGHVQFGNASSSSNQNAKLVVQGESSGYAMLVQGHASLSASSDIIYSVNRYGISGGFQMYGDHTMLFGGGGLSLGSQVGIVPESSTRIGQIIKGAVSQSVNLQEWQDSAGTVLAAVNSAGKLGIGTASPGAKLHVVSSGAAVIGQIITGASSHSVALLQLNMGATPTGNAFEINTSAAAKIFGVTTAGNVDVNGGVNAQSLGIKSLTELLTIAAAATSTTTIQKPANAIILAVSVRNTVAVTCTTSYTVGDSGNASRFSTAAVSKALNSTDAGTKAGAYYNATAEGIIITPDTVPSDATGRVRVTVHYIDCTPPTS